MRATGKALPTAFTGGGVVLFPPVTGTADEVVALLRKFGEPMANGQIAQPQEFGDRNLVRTGKAGLALLAMLLAKPFLLPPLCRDQCLLLGLATNKAGGDKRMSRAEPPLPLYKEIID